MLKKSLLVMIALLPAISHAIPTAKAVANTQGVTTQILAPTEIYGGYGINLTNDTKKSQLFYWTLTLCPLTQPEHCQVFQDHTALYPGQKWSKAYTLHSTIVFRAIGSKPINVKTEITGAAYSIAESTQYVDVHY
jgi:hypothetical protein